MASPLELPAGWPGYLFGLAMLLFPFLVSWRKGKVDESAVILGKWKELVSAHEEQIRRLYDDFKSYRESAAREIDDLRNRVRAAEKRILELEQIVIEKDRHISGLERHIAQLSQSTALHLSKRRPLDQPGAPSEEDAEAIEKLERAGDNSTGKAKK